MAPEGVLRHVHPLGDSPRCSLADVLPTVELEGVVVGLIITVLPEPVGGAAVSDDVEEPQKFAVKPVAKPPGGLDKNDDRGIDPRGSRAVLGFRREEALRRGRLVRRTPRGTQ